MPTSITEVLVAVGLVLFGGVAAVTACNSGKAAAVHQHEATSGKLIKVLQSWDAQ